MKKITRCVKTMMFMLLCMMLFMTAEVKADEVILQKVNDLKQTNSFKDSFDVEWKSVACEGEIVEYEVYISKNKEEWNRYESYSNNYCMYGLESGSTYYIKVRAYIKIYNADSFDYDTIYGEFSDIIECVTSPEIKATQLKKTKSTESSISFKWKNVKGATGYKVVYDAANDKEKEVFVTEAKVTIKNLKKGVSYYVSVCPYRESASGYKAEGFYSDFVRLKVLPSKIKTSKVSVYVYDSIKTMSIDIDTVANADGYQVQVYNVSTGKRIATKSDEVGYVSIENKTFKKNQMYKIRVRAYVDDSGKKEFGKWSDWKYASRQVDITDLKSTSKGIKVIWDKIKGADRYVVYASTKENSGYKKVKTISKASTNSCVITKIGNKKLKSGKTYYFYVVPYEKVGGKYYKSAEGVKGIYSIKYKK